MTTRKPFPSGTSGFTLVELMVTLAVSGLIAATLYATYVLQQRSYQYQSSVIEIQQNARTAIDLLVLDLRMAGLDPEETSGAGIEVATEESVAFSADASRDGTLGTTGSGEPAEYFAFQVSTRTESGVTIPSLTRAADQSVTDAGDISTYTLQPLADFIEKMEFYYEFEDGTSSTTSPSSGKLDDIRAIQISLIARSRFPVKKTGETETFSLVSGNSWTSPEDRYIRRLVVTQVDLRNMGL